MVKAISLKEPWASLILKGKKTIETRTWKTNYRGVLLICVSKTPNSEISGKAIAVANLVDCRLMTKEDENKACCKIYAGAYSWVLASVKPIKKFVVKGRLGLYDVPFEEQTSIKKFPT